MFKGLNEFLAACFEAHGLFGVVMSVLSYGLLYSIGWLAFGFLFPWFVILLIPLFFYPMFIAFGSFHLSRLGLEENESSKPSRSFWLFVVIGLVQIYLFGIPGYKEAKLWFLIGNESFKEFYFGGFIKGFWNFWNHLNYFSKGNVPFNFYNFDMVHFQWVFLGGYVLVNGYMQFELNAGLIRDREKRAEKLLSRQKEGEEALKEHQRIERQEIEDEQRRKQEKIEAQERAKQEEIRLERLRKKKAEVEEADPWDSGFLG